MPWLGCYAGVAGANHALGHGLQDDGAGGDNCSVADGHVGGDERLGTHPGSVLDPDRAISVAKVLGPEIMVAPAKKGALGDAAVCADGAGLEIEDKDFFANPGMIPDNQFPGKMDIDSRLDHHAFTDLRSKQGE
jgi:hypothetical protein